MHFLTFFFSSVFSNVELSASHIVLVIFKIYFEQTHFILDSKENLHFHKAVIFKSLQLILEFLAAQNLPLIYSLVVKLLILELCHFSLLVYLITDLLPDLYHFCYRIFRSFIL